MSFENPTPPSPEEGDKGFQKMMETPEEEMGEAAIGRPDFPEQPDSGKEEKAEGVQVENQETAE